MGPGSLNPEVELKRGITRRSPRPVGEQTREVRPIDDSGTIDVRKGVVGTPASEDEREVRSINPTITVEVGVAGTRRRNTFDREEVPVTEVDRLGFFIRIWR